MYARYMIVVATNYNYEELERLVNLMIQEGGWTVAGGIAVCANGTLHQALTR